MKNAMSKTAKLNKIEAEVKNQANKAKDYSMSRYEVVQLAYLILSRNSGNIENAMRDAASPIVLDGKIRY